ncbi:MAG: alkaline phosphatase family protein [Acidimicrobiales bacterium]|jgi:phospholipase C
MAGPSRDNALDHVVVIAFENRSFDNLLGRLYEPGEVASFEGVIGKDLSNPIPPWAQFGADRKVVPYGVAANMDTPNPDPGEEYQHVNTQLFGIIDPEANRCKLADKMVAPYNLPSEPLPVPSMDGFVADYISAFTSEIGRQPSYDEYAQIMTGFTPDQMPVVSTLARGFATFDHWFCEVPSQTFTNRSFFHAATACGFVVNTNPPDSFPVRNTAETLFERLESKGLTWRIYCDPPSHVSFTGLVHAARLYTRFAHNFFTTDRFLEDAEKGDLPTYSFIEPNMWHGHNDMHPAFNSLLPGLKIDAPESLIGGEALLAKIYRAVRSSSSTTGSNAYNTLLMVNFDEHGGTYDHVPPPAVAPPDPSAPPGQFGFRFDRSGVRVPALAISAWIPPRTVVNDEYRNTSIIRTMRERWSLGAPFSARDGAARDVAPVLSLDTPRAPEDWPEVTERPVPRPDAALLAADVPLRPMARAALSGLLALGKQIGRAVPDTFHEGIKSGEAISMLHDTFGHIFPGLREHS